MIVMDVSAATTIVRCGIDDIADSIPSIFDERIIAPSFFRVEAAQVAWKYTNFGSLDAKGTQKLMASILNCIDQFYEDESLIAEALTEGLKLGHSVYDMLYFVLARRTASALLTCNHALANICAENNVERLELTRA